jgi:hypothetical protein
MTSHIGGCVEGVFPVAGSSIPLRPGSWLILCEDRTTQTRAVYASYYLGLVDGGRLKEGMRVNSFIRDPGDKDVYSKIKEFDNELYNVTHQNAANGSQSCWVIRNIIMGWTLDAHDKTVQVSAFDRVVAIEMHKRSIIPPSEFLMVQFTPREPSRALEVQYFIDVADVCQNDAREPAHWRESDFAPLNIRRHPEKFARFREVVGWASDWWPKFSDCFSTFQPASFW